MHKVIIVSAVLLASMTFQGMAQGDYPSRPIQIIVPFTPGGGNDLMARALGDKLQKRWGQPVIVENKPGAGHGNVPICDRTRCGARPLSWFRVGAY